LIDRFRRDPRRAVNARPAVAVVAPGRAGPWRGPSTDGRYGNSYEVRHNSDDDDNERCEQVDQEIQDADPQQPGDLWILLDRE